MPGIFENLNIAMLQRNSLALIIGIVLVLLVNFILKRVFQRFSKPKATGDNIQKWHLFLNAISKPLRIYLWLLIVFYGVYFVAIKIFDLSYDAWYGKFVTISTFAVFLWIIFRLIKDIEYFYMIKLPKGKPSYSFEISGIKALSRLAQVGVLLLFMLIILGILEIPVSGLITAGGISGIAVAYAGKDILSNFLGGVMIYLNRQFAIGDSVRSPDRDIEGTVEQMGWRYTTIRRPDKYIMYVPNSIFSGILLINQSRIDSKD